MARKPATEVLNYTSPLTVEQARTAPLSRNPITRLRQLKRYGATFNLRVIGFSPLPQYMTRGDLVRTAKAHEEAEQLLRNVRNNEQA